MAAGQDREARRGRATASPDRGGRSSLPSRPPHQSSSGCSWSKASASSAPSISIQSRFLRPGRDLADDDRRRARRASVSNWTTAASSVVDRRALAAGRPPARTRAPVPRWPLRHGGEHARGEPRDAMAGDELGEVAPVRADVGERARRAAELLVHAPVGVVGAQEPVLEVGAVDEADRAGLARARRARAPRAPSGSSGRRTAPRPGAPASPRRVDEPLRRRASVERQRLLADRRACRPRARPRRAAAWRWFGRADVDDVDVGVADQLLGGVDGPLRAERGGGRLARSGDEAAHRRPGGRRRAAPARAWTAPMNPVPAMADPAATSCGNLYERLQSSCQAKVCVYVQCGRLSTWPPEAVVNFDHADPRPHPRPQGRACC